MTHPDARPAIPAIEAIDLTRSLPLGGESVPILRGISFTVDRGEWIALTGPSGSGKSTLLGILAGLDSPTSGRIFVDGTDVTRLGERAMARLRNEKIGVVFQSFNLISSLTAQENVEAPLHVGSSRLRARDAAREVLGLVGLSDRLDHRPHQLSGGQQQRVAIARALVTRPALLIADEPTGNLDSTTGEAVLALLEGLRRDLRFTVVVATHDPQVAARADRNLHIVDGLLTEPAR
jgi:putative ABC transport system ATP-binding protein